MRIQEEQRLIEQKLLEQKKLKEQMSASETSKILNKEPSVEFKVTRKTSRETTPLKQQLSNDTPPQVPQRMPAARKGSLAAEVAATPSPDLEAVVRRQRMMRQKGYNVSVTNNDILDNPYSSFAPEPEPKFIEPPPRAELGSSSS